MIPLSLYVTIELCKILQVYHIHNNTELFDMQTNKRTECRAMNITEELGQVNICFSFFFYLYFHAYKLCKNICRYQCWDLFIDIYYTFLCAYIA